MYVKRFTGATVSEALAAARRALGEDTLLLGTRTSIPGGGAEVTVALERPEPVPAPPVRPPAPVRELGLDAAVAPARGIARRELSVPAVADKRREIAVHDERIRDLEARFDLLSQRIRHLSLEMKEEEGSSAPATFRAPDSDGIVARLVETGLAEEIASRAAKAAIAREPESGFDSEEVFLDALAEELASFVPAARGDEDPARRVVAIVGPTGAGKTTTAAKLAAQAHLRGRSVALVGADDYRIGAFEQLRECAEALEIPLERVRDAASLAAALARHRERDLVVIDTPGVPLTDGEQLLRVGRLLEAARGAVRLLCVPAPTRARDVAATIARFRALGALRLVYSKMDDTSFYGELLGAAASASCPVAAIATGRGIPDDYEEIGPERLAEIVVRSAWRRA